MDDTVERLYQRLTQALQRTRRDAFAGPVTVAEIYQELVPYRAVRGEAGFDMNADYEHALLRLLAGEGDLARLEPAHARDQITKELRSPNPNVSIYREYAGCDVFVNAPAHGPFDDAAASLSDVLADDDGADEGPWDELLLLDAAEEDAEEDADDDVLPFSLVDQESEAKQPAAAQPPARTDRPAPKAAAPPPQRSASVQPQRPAAAQPQRPAAPRAPSLAGAAATPPPAEASEDRTMTRCSYCDADLPANRSVRFCPYCGQDQTAAPCPACGEALEPGWTFCVACGVARGVP